MTYPEAMQICEILRDEANRLALQLGDKRFCDMPPHVEVGVRREMKRLRSLADVCERDQQIPYRQSGDLDVIVVGAPPAAVQPPAAAPANETFPVPF